MTACHRKPDNKKKFIGSIGKALVHRHGKKPFYKPSEIRQAADTCGYAVDLHCWAYCVFLSPSDFAALHAAAGELCDYAAMKAEMLTELASGASFSAFDIDLPWLEWSDIDLSFLWDSFDPS